RQPAFLEEAGGRRGAPKGVRGVMVPQPLFLLRRGLPSPGGRGLEPPRAEGDWLRRKGEGLVPSVGVSRRANSSTANPHPFAPERSLRSRALKPSPIGRGFQIPISLTPLNAAFTIQAAVSA